MPEKHARRISTLRSDESAVLVNAASVRTAPTRKSGAAMAAIVNTCGARHRPGDRARKPMLST